MSVPLLSCGNQSARGLSRKRFPYERRPSPSSGLAESIKKIEKYTLSGKPVFERDELIQIWVLHHLQVLGEAARGVSEETQQKYPQIPWGKIIGFRNILVHHYFAVNTDEIWAVVQVNIPPLKKELERILAQDPVKESGRGF